MSASTADLYYSRGLSPPGAPLLRAHCQTHHPLTEPLPLIRIPEPASRLKPVLLHGRLRSASYFLMSWEFSFFAIVGLTASPNSNFLFFKTVVAVWAWEAAGFGEFESERHQSRCPSGHLNVICS